MNSGDVHKIPVASFNCVGTPRPISLSKYSSVSSKWKKIKLNSICFQQHEHLVGCKFTDFKRYHRLRMVTLSEIKTVWIRQSDLNQIVCEASSSRGRERGVSERRNLTAKMSFSCSSSDSSHYSLITAWQVCHLQSTKGLKYTHSKIIRFQL